MSKVLELHTIQMAQWRKLLETGIEIIDATVRTGNKLLAPSWDLVSATKSGTLPDTDFTKQYTDLIRNRYVNDPTLFDDMISKGKIALACYCGSDKHCHRFILRDILKKVAVSKGYTVIDKGEYP